MADSNASFETGNLRYHNNCKRHASPSGSDRMKDDLLLLITALIVAQIAWAFWHFLGESAFSVVSTLALLILTVDNFRLRRKLRPEQRR